MKSIDQHIQDVTDNMTLIHESIYNVPSKILMWAGIAFGGITYFDIKERLQFYFLIASAISITLAIILQILKIWEKRINIKNLIDKGKNELKKNC